MSDIFSTQELIDLIVALKNEIERLNNQPDSEWNDQEKMKLKGELLGKLEQQKSRQEKYLTFNSQLAMKIGLKINKNGKEYKVMGNSSITIVTAELVE